VYATNINNATAGENNANSVDPSTNYRNRLTNYLAGGVRIPTAIVHATARFVRRRIVNFRRHDECTRIFLRFLLRPAGISTIFSYRARTGAPFAETYLRTSFVVIRPGCVSRRFFINGKCLEIRNGTKNVMFVSSVNTFRIYGVAPYVYIILHRNFTIDSMFLVNTLYDAFSNFSR